MIVLDEQLTGRGIEYQISKWYRGSVCFIDDLRPRTVIKDDSIQQLLLQQNYPTFVTINERDFWSKIKAHSKYCVICFVLRDSRATEIPDILRLLFNMAEFKTKALRMGKVIRVSDRVIRFYAAEDKAVKRIERE